MSPTLPTTTGPTDRLIVKPERGLSHVAACFYRIGPGMCLQCLDAVVGRQEGHPVCKKTERWGTGVVICLERGADLHMVQRIPLPLTVSCFSKIQIGFTFLVPAHPGSPGQRAVKRVCVCVCVCVARVSAASCSHVNTDMFVVLQIIIMPIYTFYRGGLKWCR